MGHDIRHSPHCFRMYATCPGTVHLRLMTKDWRPPVGARILLVKHAFWSGHTGTVLRHETFLREPSMVVELDSGEQVGATHSTKFKLLEKA